MKNNIIVDKSKKIKKYKKRGGGVYKSTEYTIDDSSKIEDTLYNHINNNIFEGLENNIMIELIKNINNNLGNNDNIIYLKNELSILINDTTPRPFARQGSETINICANCYTFQNSYNFFDSILYLILQYNKDKNIFGKIYKEFNDTSLFTYYKLWNFESQTTYITVDPTIIQFLIFDNNDVHSLKIIYKNNKVHIRYTTDLFPNNTYISNFAVFDEFNKFNNDINTLSIQYNNDLKTFLLKYYNLYLFYRKCINIVPENIKFYNYHLKYISILGKARFFDKDLQLKCKHITEYILTNLLFINPSYAFISGGYKGFESNAYGITRSGYELSKQYNRPILTIMCNEGLTDSHKYSDAILIYGEHWGEDTIALSQFTDGAIIVAPFGGWTYVECLCLLDREKIVGIYNDNFNILNYLSDKKNINFFKFNKNEQLSMIQFSINYYSFIYSLSYDTHDKLSKKCESILKALFFIYEIIDAINNAKNDINFDKIVSMLDNLLQIINKFKINIDIEINSILQKENNNLNSKYKSIFDDTAKNYQNTIPINCDGLWIHPKYANYINTFYTFARRDELKNILISSDIFKTRTEKLYNLYDEIKLKNDNIKNYSCWRDNKKLNKEIIFVFSNMISLGTYISEKLDSTYYNEQLNKKIEQLMLYKFDNETLGKVASRYKTVKLKKNLDGYLDNSGEIINQNIVKDDYIFNINENCIAVFNQSSNRSNTIAMSRGNITSARAIDDIHRTLSIPNTNNITNSFTGGKKIKKYKL
jgi:hypothetical protein